MKHKHADLIHAWADGAEIQYYDTVLRNWQEADRPDWLAFTQYRIKPEEKKPVVRWLWAYQDMKTGWTSTEIFFTEEEAKCLFSKDHLKLEWSRTEFPE